LFNPQRCYLGPNAFNLGVSQQHPLGLEGIQVTIYLNAQALYRRAFGTIENAGVDGSSIGQLPHQSTQGLNFRNQLAFTRPTHCRVAGH
jgi:hypothetical protein